MQAALVKAGWILATSTAVRSTGSTTRSGSPAEISAIEAGFPHDFIASTREFVYGEATVKATVRR